MKKLLILVLAVICMLPVFACNKNQVYFDAIVTEYSVDLYTVEVTDKGTSSISLTSKAFVYGDKLPKNTPEFSVGDSIRVYFGGPVAEISPLDLGEIYKVELLEEATENTN